MSKVGEQVCSAFENICKADEKWIRNNDEWCKDVTYMEVRELLVSAIETFCQFDGLESNYKKGIEWLRNSSLREDRNSLMTATYHYLHGAALDLIKKANILDMFLDYRKDYFSA